MSIITAFDWDQYARCYDSILALSPYRDMLSEVVQKSVQLGGGKILDASCGTGNFIEFLNLQDMKEWEIVGVDSSATMLNRALEKCFQVSNCSFRLSDLNQTLPFSNGSFDQVVSLNTLYAVDKPEVTLREFFRVLKPGGHLLLVNPKTDFENGLILKAHAQSQNSDSYWMDGHSSPEREESLIREALGDSPLVEDMLMVAAYNREIRKSSSFYFFTQEEIREILKKAGFTQWSFSSTYANQDFFVIAN